jgi:hypothetical protein
METKEIWYPIEGYEGLYEVSNFGRIKSLGNNKTRKMKILKTVEGRDGYLLVNLSKNGKVKSFQVHRLVAEAFIPNWFDNQEVNHIDEDKKNNHIDNLEWCEHKYNCNYGTRIKRISEKLFKSILQYTKSGVFVREWASIIEADRNGFNKGNVTSCCRGERKTHKGYIWKYK